MPNTVSSEKRTRQNQARRARNRTQRTGLRTQLKKARQALAEKDPNAAQVLIQTQVVLDKATSAGLLHRNKAARLKSRLAAAARVRA